MFQSSSNIRLRPCTMSVTTSPTEIPISRKIIFKNTNLFRECKVGKNSFPSVSYSLLLLVSIWSVVLRFDIFVMADMLSPLFIVTSICLAILRLWPQNDWPGHSQLYQPVAIVSLSTILHAGFRVCQLLTSPAVWLGYSFVDNRWRFSYMNLKNEKTWRNAWKLFIHN